MALSPAQYDLLERAVARGSRLVITRKHGQWIVVARRLVVKGAHETLEAVHPSTGDALSIAVDEIMHLELVR